MATFEEVFEKPLLRELFLTSMTNQIEIKLGRASGGLQRFLRDLLKKEWVSLMRSVDKWLTQCSPSIIS